MQNKCFAIDYHAVERFFRSCATTMAMSHSIRIRWQEYKDSKVLNAIYTVFFWKGGPGWAEIDIKTARELQVDIERQTDVMVQAWLKKLYTGGPFVAQQYINDIAALRAGAQNTINEAFKQVSDINADVLNQTKTSISRLAKVQLAAGIGVAVISGGAGVLMVGGATVVGGISLGGGGLAFAAVGTSNSVALSVIKTWEQGGTAKAVALDFGKSAVTEGSGAAAGYAAQTAGAAKAAASRTSQNALVEANRYADLLGRKSTQQGNNIAKWTQRAQTAQHTHSASATAAAKAGTRQTVARSIGYALPVVFAAADIFGSVKTYNEVMDSL